MGESILDSVKKMLGIMPDYTHFDMDLITHINMVFGILFQLGVGEQNFSISDNTATWDLVTTNPNALAMIKTYVYAKVRMVFDPPQSSQVAEAMKNTIAELESRINYEVDPKEA